MHLFNSIHLFIHRAQKSGRQPGTENSNLLHPKEVSEVKKLFSCRKRTREILHVPTPRVLELHHENDHVLLIK